MSGPLTSAPVTIPAASLSKEAAPVLPLENASTVLPGANVDYSVGVGTKNADILILYDELLHSSADQMVRVYANYVYGHAEVKSFAGFEGLVSLLQTYATIRELVLFIHGAPGVFEFYYPGNASKQKTMRQLVELFQGKAPAVTYQVVLESCNVAADPDQVMALKDLFQTPRITGWNYYHIPMVWLLPIWGTVTSADITAKLEIPDQYLAPGSPHPTSFAGQSGTFEILYEWFREIEDRTRPSMSPDESIFIPRSKARTIALVAGQATGMTTLKDPAVINADESIPADQKLAVLHDASNWVGRVEGLAQVTIRD